MSQPNKDNRPEAVLDRVLEKTGVMSQPKSNEEIVEHYAELFGYEYKGDFALHCNHLREILAQKDAEVAEAVKESFNHFSWCRECGEGPFCREALSIAEKYGVDLTPKE